MTSQVKTNFERPGIPHEGTSTSTALVDSDGRFSRTTVYRIARVESGRAHGRDETWKKCVNGLDLQQVSSLPERVSLEGEIILPLLSVSLLEGVCSEEILPLHYLEILHLHPGRPRFILYL